MLSLPKGAEEHESGCDDSHPLVLEGIDVNAFIHLLRLLYPK